MRILGRFPKLSLSHVLVVPFVTQIFIAVGLTGYASFRHGQIAIEQLVDQLSDESRQRVDQHLSSYLAQPHQVNHVIAKSLERGLLPRDRRRLGHYFWEQMRAYPEFAYINFGDTAGNLIAINRHHNGTLEMDITEPPHIGTYYRYAIDQGQPTQLATRVAYEFRQEAWYTDAVAAKKPIWTSIYFWSDDQFLAISSSHPVFDDRQQLIGVMGIDYLLDRISKFLGELRPSASATVFILEREGLLVANSTPDPTYTVVNSQPRRVKGLESSNLLIRAATQQLIEQFGDLKHIQGLQKIKVSVNDQVSFVRVNPWRDRYGLDWLVVVAVPESDFTGQIHQNARTTVLLCVIVVVITAYLGSITARWLAQPIHHLNQASFAIAQGNLNQTVKISHIEELATLARSFNQMVAQMQASLTALEHANAELERRVEERTEKLSTALKDLQMAQAQMLQAEKMSSLGQMVAGIAHEMNNPITFISGNLIHVEQYTADLIRLVSLYEQYCSNTIPEIHAHMEQCDLGFIVKDLPASLKSMRAGAKRIKTIVSGLRNFSRLDEAQLKEVDLHDGIDNALLLLQHRLQHTRKRQEIQVIQDFGPLPKIECYAGQLNQVFLNVLSNAIDALDHVSDRPGRIWITTEATESSAIVRIRDNADGIPDAIRSKIFDPFFTTKLIGQGTGLGLSIAYQIIVGQHRGSLTYTSTCGEGTEFAIEIPISIHD